MVLYTSKYWAQAYECGRVDNCFITFTLYLLTKLLLQPAALFKLSKHYYKGVNVGVTFLLFYTS